MTKSSKRPNLQILKTDKKNSDLRNMFERQERVGKRTTLSCRALQDNAVQYFSQNVINGKWLDISELRLHSNNSQSRARALAPFHKLPEPSSSYSSKTRYCRAEPELSWLVSTGSSWSRIRAACPTLSRACHHFDFS